MPLGYPPSVFVSSTCYDLSQIRLDLKGFIQDLGYEAIISESPVFPIDPHSGTLENCLRAVRDRGDLFVLVIGGRYGSQNNQGKSITNLEYIEARTKNIPIYVFVAKNVLGALPVWKDNPDGNFTSTVDTPKLFEFVQELRTEFGHWVFGFENAKDIIETLRHQWAVLFSDSLAARARLRAAHLSPQLAALPPKAIAILMERPPLWEHRFFSEALRFELEPFSNLRRDVKFGLKLGSSVGLADVQELMAWLTAQNHRLQGLVHSLSQLANVSLTEAFGPPGTPGDPEFILYVARRMAETVRETLLWTLAFLNAHAPDEFQRILILTSNFSSTIVDRMFSFSELIETKITEAEAKHAASGGRVSADLTLNLELPDMTEFHEEIARLASLYTAS